MDKTFLSHTRLPTIKELRSLAYKKAFVGLSYQEAIILDKALSFYPKTQLSTKEINELISINKILIKFEQGGFREMKEKLKEFKLDYRSIYAV
jgi:hypothetical protein